MNQSSQLKFDYLTASQAQKHLTVNDALARIDALTHLVVHPNSETIVEGHVQLAQNGRSLEINLNGGRVTVEPEKGWSGWFLEDETERRFDGAFWQKSNRDGVKCRPFLVDLAQSESLVIPAKSIVFGVTARVIENIEGDGVQSWKLGVAEDLGRYGSGLWLGQNGWAKGLTGTPITYWNDTPLEINGQEGAITAGKVMLYLYLLEFDLPPEV